MQGFTRVNSVCVKHRNREHDRRLPSRFWCVGSQSGARPRKVVQCQDTTFRHSEGETGACSYHSGVMSPLSAHEVAEVLRSQGDEKP